MAPGSKPRKPLPRPALRDGVTCGGAQKAPPLYPAPFSFPHPSLAPAARRFPAPTANPAHKPRQSRLGDWVGQGCYMAGKSAQPASQGQTAGDGQGGALAPPAARLYRHFRPVMEQFTSLARKGRTFPPPLFVRCNPPVTARSAAGSKLPSFAGEALFLLD